MRRGAKWQLLAQQVGSMERVARQYAILRNSDSLSLLRQDYATINETLDSMMPLAEEADAVPLARAIRVGVQHVLTTLRDDALTAEAAEQTIAEFATIRRRVTEFNRILSNQIDLELEALQASTDQAQRIAAWQA